MIEAPRTAKDIRELLAKTMAEVRSGRLETKIATTIAYIAQPLLKALETEELEVRVARMEKHLKRTGGSNGSAE